MRQSEGIEVPNTKSKVTGHPIHRFLRTKQSTFTVPNLDEDIR